MDVDAHGPARIEERKLVFTPSAACRVGGPVENRVKPSSRPPAGGERGGHRRGEMSRSGFQTMRA